MMLLQCKNSYNPGMVNLFKPRRLTIWIACIAILLNALAPSLSHARYAVSPSGAPSILIEVCTAHGTKTIAVAGEQTSDAALQPNDGHKKPIAGSEHCLFCLSHHASPFLLPAAASSFILSAQQGLMPPLFYQSPQPLFSWAAAHPRGPPAAS